MLPEESSDQAQISQGRRIVLVGGSGFLGRGLRASLTALGHDVVVIGRGPTTQHAGWRSVHWDAATRGSWVNALEGADTIVHLAGKRVDTRPTVRNIGELISSREGTVKLVGQALQDLSQPPTTWVQLSSLAIFGDSGDALIDEATTPPAHGLAQQVEVVQRWEAAYRDASSGMQRKVLLRPAIGVGGSADPATRQLARLARLGLGGAIGGGQQWVSWIGALDFFELLQRSVLDNTMSGLYHLTSPTPVTNADFMRAYRLAVGRRFGVPSPRTVASVGAWLLGSDPALPLTGRRCVPGRLLREGYTFKQTNVDTAVAAAIDAQS